MNEVKTEIESIKNRMGQGEEIICIKILDLWNYRVRGEDKDEEWRKPIWSVGCYQQKPYRLGEGRMIFFKFWKEKITANQGYFIQQICPSEMDRWVLFQENKSWGSPSPLDLSSKKCWEKFFNLKWKDAN